MIEKSINETKQKISKMEYDDLVRRVKFTVYL